MLLKILKHSSSWLAVCLSVLTVVLLNASRKGHQRSFRIKCISVAYGMAIRDLFHVYLNRFEFHFLRLHVIKTKKILLFHV